MLCWNWVSGSQYNMPPCIIMNWISMHISKEYMQTVIYSFYYTMSQSSFSDKVSQSSVQEVLSIRTLGDNQCAGGITSRGYWAVTTTIGRRSNITVTANIVSTLVVRGWHKEVGIGQITCTIYWMWNTLCPVWDWYPSLMYIKLMCMLIIVNM